jgi:hypothetical protein
LKGEREEGVGVLQGEGESSGDFLVGEGGREMLFLRVVWEGEPGGVFLVDFVAVVGLVLLIC